VRQHKFKRGKERMISIAQESGEGPTLIQPEEDDDDGMTTADSVCAVNVREVCVEVTSSRLRSQGRWLRVY